MLTAWSDIALSAGQVGAWRIDYRRHAVLGTDQFWAILGLPDAAFERLDGLVPFIDPRDWSKLATAPEGRGGSGDFAFAVRIIRPDGKTRRVALRGVWENNENLHCRTGVVADLSVWGNSAQASEADAQGRVVLEQRHRLRNLFTIIAALIKMVGEVGDRLPKYRQALLERLRALESTHLMLADDVDGGSTIEDIVRHELRPYQRADHAVVKGPLIRITGGAAESFAMVVHELATNSVKHGVLGAPEGRLDVSWAIVRDLGEDEITFEWVESGRPLAASKLHGFGSMILGVEGAPIVGHSSRLDVTGDVLRYSLRLTQAEI